MNQILAIIGAISLFVLASFFSVQGVYLGHIDETQTLVGTVEWLAWYETQLNASACYNKEILNTVDCCGGYVETYCKKFWFPMYTWSEMHAMGNDWHVEWGWKH
jgi:hypothetical protein